MLYVRIAFSSLKSDGPIFSFINYSVIYLIPEKRHNTILENFPLSIFVLHPAKIFFKEAVMRVTPFNEYFKPFHKSYLMISNFLKNWEGWKNYFVIIT